MQNKKCIVKTCLNSSGKKEGKPTIFHYFPTNEDIRSKWLKNLPNSVAYQELPFSVLKNMTVCHLHFETNQYQNKERKRLLRGAVPTIFLENISSVQDVSVLDDNSNALKNNTVIQMTAENISQPVKETTISTKENNLGCQPSDKKHITIKKTEQFVSNFIPSKDCISRKKDDTFDNYENSQSMKDICEDESIILDNFDHKLVHNYFEKVTLNKERSVIKNRSVPVEKSTEENSREKSNLLDYHDANLDKNNIFTDYVKQQWKTLMKCVYESKPEKSIKKDLPRKQENKNNSNIVKDVLSKVDGILITKTKNKRCYNKLVNHDQDENRHRILNRMKSQKQLNSNIAIAENIKYIPPVEKGRKDKVEKPSFTCEKCKKIFKNRSEFNKHKNRHEGIKNFYCEKCGIGFFSIRQLKKHLILHENKNFECEICHKTFKEKRHLHNHKQIHQQEQFICEVCGVTKKNYISLKMHMICHSNEWKFSCTFCSNRFKRKTDLRNHLRTHTNERPYKCTKCDESYRTSYSLKIHFVKFHLKVPSFKCKFCDKQFYAKKNLDQHYKTHISNRVVCTLCNEPFTSLSNLDRHVRIVHQEVKNFECKICKKRFGEEHNLAAHVGIQSNENFKCSKCSKEFNDIKYLNQHYKVHTSDRVSCTLCDKAFTSLSNLHRHIRLVHYKIKSFECKICKKRFGEGAYLKAHMVIHSNERFKCPKCSIFFKLPSYLKVHIKRKHSDTQVYECSDCKGIYETIEDIQMHDCGSLLQHDSTNFSDQ